MVTTIQLQEKTKTKLDTLKEYARETYEEVIQKLISLVEEEKMELSEDTKKSLVRAEEDIKKGRVHTTKELIKELGI